MQYLANIVVLICIYCILTTSLDLLIGHTGLLSVSHAGFFGVGAYSSALVAVDCGGSFLVGFLVGILLALILSLIVSVPTLRLKDDYFVIATFSLQIILFGIFNNWLSLTHGPGGISAIPVPTIFGIVVQSYSGFVLLAIILAVFAFLVVYRLSSSPLGRVLHAIREDEILAQSLGKNVVAFKVMVFVISATLASLAGSLYAHYLTYIDPTSFNVMESILILAMVVIGGAGSPWGPLAGAAVLVILPEALRFVGLPWPLAANLRQVLYGVLLVLLAAFRPRGLFGRYSFGR